MHSQHAFTLLEALIALTIISIISMITLPNLQEYFFTTQDEIFHSRLLHTLQFAQQEAEIQHMPIALCKSKTYQLCDGEWLDGQLVFKNENQDGLVKDKNNIISVRQNSQTKGQIHWRSFPFYRDYLLFFPVNWHKENNGTFWYCHSHVTKPVWAIKIGRSGQFSSAYPDVNGNINDAKGHPLSCVN